MNRYLFFLLILLLLSSCGQAEQSVSVLPSPAPTEYGLAVEVNLSDGGSVNGIPMPATETSAVYKKESDAKGASKNPAQTEIHITQPGTYRLSGKLTDGRILVDLGEEAEENKASSVLLILSGAEITCSGAPALQFSDSSETKATIFLPEESTNQIHWTPEFASSDAGAAVVSSLPLEILGGGKLEIRSAAQGIAAERGLTLSGGKLQITADVCGVHAAPASMTVNGGTLDILVTGDGDCVDGPTVVHDGTVFSQSAQGRCLGQEVTLRGGIVLATGSQAPWIASGGQEYRVFRGGQAARGETYTVKATDGTLAGQFTADCDFSVLLLSQPEMKADVVYGLYRDNGLVVQGTGEGDAPSAGNSLRPEGIAPENRPEFAPPSSLEPPAKPVSPPNNRRQDSSWERPSLGEGMAPMEPPEMGTRTQK